MVAVARAASVPVEGARARGAVEVEVEALAAAGLVAAG